MIRELRFKILCQRHCDAIFRYALVLLGNRADAEETTQEVLLRLWQNMDKFNVANARAWTYRTTRNLCLDQIRRRTSRSAPVLVSDEVLAEHADDSAPDPRLEADAGFMRDRIAKVLLDMPEKLRSVLPLRDGLEKITEPFSKQL
jgi:RNA polymerase sigma-70 factor, ECF subfamily